MATQFLLGPQPALRPVFLFGRLPGETKREGFPAVLGAAAATVTARAEIRNPRQQIALLLSEIGKRLGCKRDLPLSRPALAKALGVSLVRVKRTVALLCLSGVLDCDGDSIRVLDWRKLSGAARFDPGELGLAEEADFEIAAEDEVRDQFLTASGDPACFV
jgi:hypothetical protein